MRGLHTFHDYTNERATASNTVAFNASLPLTITSLTPCISVQSSPCTESDAAKGHPPHASISLCVSIQASDLGGRPSCSEIPVISHAASSPGHSCFLACRPRRDGLSVLGLLSAEAWVLVKSASSRAGSAATDRNNGQQQA